MLKILLHSPNIKLFICQKIRIRTFWHEEFERGYVRIRARNRVLCQNVFRIWVRVLVSQRVPSQVNRLRKNFSPSKSRRPQKCRVWHNTTSTTLFLLTSRDFHAWFFVYLASTNSGWSRDSKIKGSRSWLVREPRKNATFSFSTHGNSSLFLKINQLKTQCSNAVKLIGD